MAVTDLDKYNIVQSTVSGKTTAQTSRELGFHRETVDRVKIERRKQIARETERYLESLPKAIDIQKNLIDSYPTLDPKTDKTKFKASVKASEEAMKASGILPTNANSIAIQAIYNDNRSVRFSPAVAHALSRLIPGLEDVEAAPDQETYIDDDPLHIVDE